MHSLRRGPFAYPPDLLTPSAYFNRGSCHSFDVCGFRSRAGVSSHVIITVICPRRFNEPSAFERWTSFL